VAVLFYPVATLAGLVLKSGAEAVDALPRQLLIVPSPQTVLCDSAANPQDAVTRPGSTAPASCARCGWPSRWRSG
jgi:hypothetical protein